MSRPRRPRLRDLGLRPGWLRAVRKAARSYLRDAIRGVRRRASGSSGVPVDPAERRARVAGMGARAATGIARARLRTIAASPERKKAAIEEAAMRSAEDVLKTMGDMKGAVMKVAQMASFAIDGLPPHIERQLATLQTAAPPMTYELASGVVRSELGGRPEEVFASFEQTPLAAASIGQVHRATTHDGREVVVKVQYPGVDEAVLADLQNADMLFSTVAAMFGGFDPRALLEEVVARMSEEFDYRREAVNQQWFADRYRDHPYVKIPEVVSELSSQRVLTTEYVAGRRFYDALADPQNDRDRYGEIVYRFAFGSIHRDGVFSGDPHPGNYLFCPDGRICFIDFGLVKRLSKDEQRSLRGPLDALLSGDRAQLMDAARQLGIVPPDADVDPDGLWEFFSTAIGAAAWNETYRYTRKKVGDTVRRMFMFDSDLAQVTRQLNLPPWMALFNRYAFGTAAVLGHLQAERNWHRIIREIVYDDPPSTEIGERWGLERLSDDRDDAAPPSNGAQVSTPPASSDDAFGMRPSDVFVELSTPEALAEPYPVYRRLREEGRVINSPPIWAITRYEDVFEILRDPRFGSDPTKADMFKMIGGMLGDDHPLLAAMRNMLLFQDPPDHDRLRGLVQSAFTRHAVERLRPRVEEIANELLEDASGEVDLVSAYAYPLPVSVIVELLGVPADDRHRFREWSQRLTALLGLAPEPDLLTRGVEALQSFQGYLRELVDERRANPGEGLLDALVAAEHEGSQLTTDELVTTCVLLLIAGHETTTNLIGNGTIALLRNPAELARLRESPELIRNAVEELLRYDSPVQATGRTVLEDVEIAGVPVPAGQRLSLLLGSANHDPDRFSDPDRLDLGRSDVRHLAFGAGIHFCLGAPLARLEAQVALGTLFSRFGSLDFAGDVEWRQTFVLRGPKRLPLRLR